MFNKKKEIKTKFIVITDSDIIIEKTVTDLNKRLNTAFEISEFKRLGNDYIISCTNQDICFLQDKKRMINIPWQHLIKKDNHLDYMIYGVYIILFIVLIRG